MENKGCCPPLACSARSASRQASRINSFSSGVIFTPLDGEPVEGFGVCGVEFIDIFISEFFGFCKQPFPSRSEASPT